MKQRLLDLFAYEVALCELEFNADNEFQRKCALIARAIAHARIDQILMRRRAQAQSSNR